MFDISLIQCFQVNVPEKLQQILTSQQGEDQARRLQEPKWIPAGRIVKGLPVRARARSGPPDSPTRPGPPRIAVSPEGEQADVEMKDGQVGHGKHVYQF
jgi:hypothetical protein